MELTEIETKVTQYRYDEKSERVICQLCKQVFKYDISLEQGRKQSASLIHLKDNLKHHLSNSASHKAALDKSEAKDKIEKKEESRNEKFGMTMGIELPIKSSAMVTPVVTSLSCYPCSTATAVTLRT